MPLRPPRFTVRRMMGAVAVVAVLMGMTMCLINFDPDPFGGIRIDEMTAEQIQGSARITLPQGAKHLHSAISGFQGHTIWVRFEMPAGQEEFFLSKLPPGLTLAPASRPPLRMLAKGPDRSWWAPEQARNFSAGEVDFHAYGEAQCVLIDRTDPQTLTVYVVEDE